MGQLGRRQSCLRRLSRAVASTHTQFFTLSRSKQKVHGTLRAAGGLVDRSDVISARRASAVDTRAPRVPLGKPWTRNAKGAACPDTSTPSSLHEMSGPTLWHPDADPRTGTTSAGFRYSGHNAQIQFWGPTLPFPWRSYTHTGNPNVSPGAAMRFGKRAREHVISHFGRLGGAGARRHGSRLERSRFDACPTLRATAV